MLGAALLGGCTHHRNGPVSWHYGDFAVEQPRGNTVHVCHAYGCKKQTRYTFSESEVGEIRAVMAKARKADTPAEERRAVAYAVGWIETRVGDKIGTKADRAGMDFTASGDPTQQDCVDEATNTTSYLLMLAHNGLIKHHTVGTPFAKDALWRGVSGWTHWTAVLKENGKRPALGGRQLDLRQRREPGDRRDREVVHRGPRQPAAVDAVTPIRLDSLRGCRPAIE